MHEKSNRRAPRGADLLMIPGTAAAKQDSSTTAAFTFRADQMTALTPIDIDVDRQAAITIRWQDQSQTRLPLALLRKWCPCATCRARREEQLVAEAQPSAKTGGKLPVLSHKAPVAAMVTLADAELVGHYALRLKWSDGHDTGIYDYSYLHSLGQAPPAG